MASVTLAESAKLSLNMLVSGVIENIVTVNPFYQVLPFAEIEGNALSYNRENVAGDVQMAAVGDTITAKAAATFTNVTSSLTTIVGDAEVNGLIQATRSNFTDQKAAQIASKAKTVGRKFQEQMIIGAGASADMTGLLSLVASSQSIIAGGSGGNGAALSFTLLDQLIDLVTDKDGQVDYLMMNQRTIRSFLVLLRALGGAGINEVMELPSGTKVPVYRGIPIFANNWIPLTQTQGTTLTCTTVLAGTLDDGSMTHGISGLTAAGDAGIRVEEVGVSATKDETITRVKMYAGLAMFSSLGLAALTGITD